VLKM